MPGSEYTFDDLVYYTKRYVSRHMKVIMPVVLLVCVVVTVGIALITHRNHPNEVAAGAASEETENLPLEKDAYPDVNALFKTYYDAMAAGIRTRLNPSARRCPARRRSASGSSRSSSIPIR